MTAYPNNSKEFDAFFPDEDSCLHYLFNLRWPEGYVCPYCHKRSEFWMLNRGKIKCRSCHHVYSILADTIFHRSHTPLLIWFKIMWHFCLQKNGYSALSLKRSLGFTYQTAWLCLHKLRKAMVRKERELLSGEVEVDETYIGGVHEGKRGRGADGKSIVFVAAERRLSPNGKRLIIGRARMLCIPNVSRATLFGAITALIEPGSTIVSDGWKAYKTIEKHGYAHKVEESKKTSKKDETPFGEEHLVGEDSSLPNCHRVMSLAKRWILGTLQGSLGMGHTQDYLNEFIFRFNRRNSKSRGLLFLRLTQMAIDNSPTTCQEIISH